MTGPKNLTASHCTNRSLLRKTETRVLRMFLKECDENHSFLVRNQDTHGRVYSHRLSYLLIKSAKRRRLFLWQVK